MSATIKSAALMSSTIAKSALALAATVAAFAAVWSGMERPDTLIERSVASAIDGLEGPRVASARVDFDPAHIHLSHLPAATATVGWMVGARLALPAGSGGTATYEVTQVRPLAAAVSFDGGTPEGGMTLVTASSVDSLPVHTVRFIVDTNSAAIRQPLPARPHAL